MIISRWNWKSLSRVWLFATPQTVACQAPLSIGFSRWEYWSEFPSPGGLPDPGIELGPPALQADSLPAEPQWKDQQVRAYKFCLIVFGWFCSSCSLLHLLLSFFVGWWFSLMVFSLSFVYLLQVFLCNCHYTYIKYLTDVIICFMLVITSLTYKKFPFYPPHNLFLMS